MPNCKGSEACPVDFVGLNKGSSVREIYQRQNKSENDLILQSAIKMNLSRSFFCIKTGMPQISNKNILSSGVHILPT